MAIYNGTNPVIIGRTAFSSDFARVFNNTIALKEGDVALDKLALDGRTADPTGVAGDTTLWYRSDLNRVFYREGTGTVKALTGDVAFDLGGDPTFEGEDASLTEIHGSMHVEIAAAAAAEVHAMCQVASGTGTIRLRNRTDALDVGAAVNITETSPTLKKITGLSLVAGKVYSLRYTGSVTIKTRVIIASLRLKG